MAFEPRHTDLKFETVRGTRLPKRPKTTRPNSVESEQMGERELARSGRKLLGQRLKSMKTRSVTVGVGGSVEGRERVVVVVVVVERRRRERRVKWLWRGREGGDGGGGGRE